MNSIVAGGYQTKFGELWDKGINELIVEAARGAMVDAGVKPSDIDLVVVANKLSGKLLSQDHLGALVAGELGVATATMRVEAACASGGVAIYQAVTAVEAGMAKCVLVVGVEKMTDVSNGVISEALMGAASDEERACGLTFVGLYSLMAEAYFDEFGASESDLAKVAVKNHWHGSLNDKAQFRGLISEDQVLKSQVVAKPLKLLDCSPITDGAAAVVIKSSGGKGIRFLGSGLASESISLTYRDKLTEIKATIMAADKAFTQAGLTRDDIDLLEVHDCFTIAEILAVEDLGFFKKGEGFKALRNGQVRLGGKLPVNVSGGLKACGHPVGATGVKQVVEVLEQLTGRAGERQVEGAKIGLTHNVGGTGGTAAIHIFEKL